jgi:hypothetical protein
VSASPPDPLAPPEQTLEWRRSSPHGQPRAMSPSRHRLQGSRVQLPALRPDTAGQQAPGGVRLGLALEGNRGPEGQEVSPPVRLSKFAMEPVDCRQYSVHEHATTEEGVGLVLGVALVPCVEEAAHGSCRGIVFNNVQAVR